MCVTMVTQNKVGYMFFLTQMCVVTTVVFSNTGRVRDDPDIANLLFWGTLVMCFVALGLGLYKVPSHHIDRRFSPLRAISIADVMADVSRDVRRNNELPPDGNGEGPE